MPVTFKPQSQEDTLPPSILTLESTYSPTKPCNFLLTQIQYLEFDGTPIIMLICKSRKHYFVHECVCACVSGGTATGVVASVIANKSKILCVKLGKMAIKDWVGEELDEGPIPPPSENKVGVMRHKCDP